MQEISLHLLINLIKMTKRKILTYSSIFALALFFSLSVNNASAFWGGKQISVTERAEMQKTMFAEQASLLGISVDEVKNAWANGQNIWELAKAKGISEDALKTKMEAMRKAKMTEELNALVSSGVITQAQADARIKFLETAKTKVEGKGKGKGRGMMMPMFHF